MFYIGSWFDENYEQAIISVIRQSLKNVKKHYHLIDLKHYKSGTDYSDIENELISLFNNRYFVTKKRVFSQDRRPAKSVKTPPLIFMNFWNRDTSKIDRLREKDIPIEGIGLRNTEGWEKEEYRTICLGHNYYVEKSDLLKALQQVTEQKRIIIEEDIQNMTDRCELFYNLDEIKMNKDPDVFFSISLSIWFKETIREIKRY